MKQNKQAIAQLEDIDIFCVEENDSVYVDIDGLKLELSEDEIKFRAKLYQEEQKESLIGRIVNEIEQNMFTTDDLEKLLKVVPLEHLKKFL